LATETAKLAAVAAINEQAGVVGKKTVADAISRSKPPKLNRL